MVEHYEQLPEDKGFPTIDDMVRWQKAFDDLVPGGNAGKLIGFRVAHTGEVMGICRLKGETDLALA